jgi:hypothetical protein
MKTPPIAPTFPAFLLRSAAAGGLVAGLPAATPGSQVVPQVRGLGGLGSVAPVRTLHFFSRGTPMPNPCVTLPNPRLEGTQA